MYWIIKSRFQKFRKVYKTGQKPIALNFLGKFKFYPHVLKIQHYRNIRTGKIHDLGLLVDSKRMLSVVIGKANSTLGNMKNPKGLTSSSLVSSFLCTTLK